MEGSRVASEDMKGRLILDGGNELLAERIVAIQKRKADTQCQEKKKQYINALINLAKNEFGISKEELHMMTVQEFNALKERIHNKAYKVYPRGKIGISISCLIFFSGISGCICGGILHSRISVLLCFMLVIVSIISGTIFSNYDGNYVVIANNKEFLEEIFPSDIQR